MSEFDFGFGSAAADKIIDEAEYAREGIIRQTIDDAAQKVKVATREMVLNFENAIRERNNKIAEIRALPEGEYKDIKVQEFKDIDDGGWFTPSFTTKVSAMQSVLEKLGLESDAPDIQTLGIIPLAALAAVPTAAWVAGTALAITIAGLATYFATQGLRYTAILVNPSAVQQADPSVTTVIGTNVSSGVKMALIIAALGGVAYMLLAPRVSAVAKNPKRGRK